MLHDVMAKAKSHHLHLDRSPISLAVIAIHATTRHQWKEWNNCGYSQPAKEKEPG